MGSGTKRPTARPAPKRSALIGDGGRPIVSCPEEGRIDLDGAQQPLAGTKVTFSIDEGDVLVRAGNKAVVRLASEEFADLAKCLRDGAVYYGEVEVDNGETSIRFWMG